MITITSDDADRPIAVKSGEDITLTLDENPTTGYRWSVESVSGELTLVSSDFERPADAKPGAGGRRTIRLRAKEPGAGELRLRYARDWQGDASGGRRSAFTFTIKSA